MKTAEEIEKIIKVCHVNQVSITGTMFTKDSEEIEKIINLCYVNKISITGSIFYKTAEALENTINYVKCFYGQDYLIPLIVNKSLKYLQEVLPYLESIGLLPYVNKSSSVLTWTLDEIKERKEFIESTGDSLVTKAGRLNSIFGLSRKNYKKMCGEKMKL